MSRQEKLLLLLATAVLVLSASVSGQIQLVRVTECGPGAFPGTTCNIPATGSGNLIVVAWASSGVAGTTIAGISDNAGNVYSQAPGARAGNSATDEVLDIWYAKNSKPGATVLTLTPNSTGRYGAAVIWEFSNVDTTAPLSQVAVLNDQSSSTSPWGPSITTSTSGELLVSAMVGSGTVTGIFSGNTFKNDSLLMGDGWAHLIASAPGTYRAQWSNTGGTYLGSAVSFKAATGSNPPPGTQLNECDLDSNGAVTSSDMNAAVNMSLGLAPCSANILGAGVCNVVVVQRVVNAALGGPCVVGTVVAHSVDLTWVASPSAGVLGYNVYRSSTTGGPYSLLNSSLVTGTTYTDSAVQSGQTYYYVVRAKSASEESGPSNEATAVIPNP